jgi:hypothetical protein
MPTSLGFTRLDFFMTTITHWLGRRRFTATKEYFFGLGSRVLYWRKTGATMRTITKRLFPTFTTSTPKIIFT